MENILLISDVMIKERTAIHGNIDPKLIYPDIKVAQDMYILPILGSALYFKLQELIEGGTISDPANEAYKTLIDIYIVDALIYYTLSELPTTISYQFWNKGVVRKMGSDTDMPSMSDLIDLSNKYRNRAEFYQNRLKKYLQQNAHISFPEYYSPGNGIDTVYPDPKSFTIPIYLGGAEDCPFPDGWDKNRPYGE
jgi:hypothetical protein